MGIARGSNIITDGLVFGYDTGHNSSITGLDSQPYHNDYRFYKGVPATNLITSGLPSYFGSGGVTSYQKTMYGFTSASGVFQRNFVNNPAQANTSTYNNNAGLVHTGLSFSSLSANTEYVMISFDFYMITPYKRHSASGTGLNGYMRIQYTDGTYTSHGWNTSLAGNNGDDWNNNDAYVGKWRKIALIVDLTDSKTPSAINQFYIYNDRTIQGEGIFTNFIITEHTTLPTSPVHWMPNGTTRTNINSLIDLKGTTNVSLANVSFDSNGQPTFDGTNDEIQLPTSDWNQVTAVTVEAVVKINGAPIDGNSYHVVVQKDGAYSGGAVYGIRISNSGLPYGLFSTGNTSSTTHVDIVDGNTMTSNQYYHLVYTRKVSESVFYQNGTATETSTSNSGTIYNNTNTVTIGEGDGRQLYGDIPVVKIYNRVLTADEVKQNYNAYKNRFNL